jgi:hypothetical protein
MKLEDWECSVVILDKSDTTPAEAYARAQPPENLLICADFCEEQGEEDMALALRWCARERRCLRKSSPYQNYNWYGETEDIRGTPYFNHIPNELISDPDYRYHFNWMDAYRWLGKQLKELGKDTHCSCSVRLPLHTTTH